MATYVPNIAALTVGSGVPAGFTQRWGTLHEFSVIEDLASPHGKSIKVICPETSTSALSYDAANDDSDRGTVDMVALVRQYYLPGTETYGPGLIARATISGANRKGVAGIQARRPTGIGACIRMLNYNEPTTVQTFNGAVSGSWTVSNLFVQRLRISGTTAIYDLYTYDEDNFYGTLIDTVTATVIASNTENWLGIFSRTLDYEADFLWLGFGTGSDSAPLPGTSSPVPVTFEGTIPTLNGRVGVPFSVDVSGYAEGTELPFAHTNPPDNLPDGLTINSSTGIIEGSPTVADTFTGVVIRYTDAAANTDDSNVFSIVIAPATEPQGVTEIISAVASATSIEVVYAYDPASAPASAPTGFEWRINEGTPSALGASPATITGLVPETIYDAPGLQLRAVNATGNGAWSTAVEVTTTAETAVVKGVRIQLHTLGVTVASTTNVYAHFWDSVAPIGNFVFDTDAATINADGVLELNLDADTALDIGQKGHLKLFWYDTVEETDSLAWTGIVSIEDIS